MNLAIEGASDGAVTQAIDQFAGGCFGIAAENVMRS